jgi:hypothetical protein
VRRRQHFASRRGVETTRRQQKVTRYNEKRRVFRQNVRRSRNKMAVF